MNDARKDTSRVETLALNSGDDSETAHLNSVEEAEGLSLMIRVDRFCECMLASVSYTHLTLPTKA